jgi:type IV secretory pathway TrbD component
MFAEDLNGLIAIMIFVVPVWLLLHFGLMPI